MARRALARLKGAMCGSHQTPVRTSAPHQFVTSELCTESELDRLLCYSSSETETHHRASPVKGAPVRVSRCMISKFAIGATILVSGPEFKGR